MVGGGGVVVENKILLNKGGGEAKYDFDWLKVGKLFVKIGETQKTYSPLALIGAVT